MRGAISFCFADRREGRALTQASASLTESCEISPIWRMSILTASASGLSRKPLQAAQGVSDMKRPISSRAQSLSVSFQRRSILVITPSKGFFTS